METKTEHPAKYTNVLLPVFADILNRYGAKSVLDPMAGIGRIGELVNYGFIGQIIANELEPEWAHQAPPSVSYVHVGDAANMNWIEDGALDAICVSPTYSNRMADKHNARDGSKRYTYTHFIGRQLNPENTGQMQWGESYRQKHIEIWRECIRVVRQYGILIINLKNHVRKGKLIEVSEWHAETLGRLGCELLERHKIKTPGMRNGANNKLRVEHEDIWVFENTKRNDKH